MLSSELLELVSTIQTHQAEFQNIEIKAAEIGSPKRIYDTLSSFSNQDSGGIIVFGLSEEKDFEVCGVYDQQQLQKTVTEQCQQMEPPVRAVFTAAQIQGKTIVSAEIPAIELTQRPCYYKGKGKYRGSFIRVGDADLPMTDYEIYSFESFKKHTRDDERIVEKITLSTLDQQRIERYIQENKINRPGFAALPDHQAYEMLNIARGEHPTLAALMNFCPFPQAIFPQYCITAIAVPGYEIGETGQQGERFSDNKRIEGTIADMVSGAIDFCKRNMKMRTKISDEGKRVDVPEYPIVAIREGILNALIHRDYSIHTEGTPVQLNMFYDRIEIHSPGTLYGRMTIEELGRARPDLRNPTWETITEKQTAAENRYSGIPTMRREMNDYGLPEPLFENRRNEFVVTLFNELHESLKQSNEYGAADKSDPAKTREMLLEYCQQPRTRKEIADYLGMKAVSYAMDKFITPMVEEKTIALTIPAKPKSKNQKYYTV